MNLRTGGRLALVGCMVFWCTCAEGTEEMGMAWMKGAPVQEARITAVIGDTSGCTLVAGDTSGDFGPESPNRGQRDAFLSKYNPDGETIWVYPLGTEGVDSASCLTVDAQGNCYVGGQTTGSLALNLTGDPNVAQEDAFVAKISPEGTCVWIRQFGSALPDRAHRVRLDANGNCYVAGTMTRSIDGTTEDRTGARPFVAKFDAKGEMVWINQVRDSNAQTGLGVGVDPNGTVTLAGEPGYLATLDANGVFLETCLLEHHFDDLKDVCADDLGHVYLVGRQGGWRSRINQYNLKGQPTWSRAFTENGWSVTKSMMLCLDGSHDVVVVGCQGGPSGEKSCQTFLRRYSQSGDLVAIFRSPEGYCGAKAGADSLHSAYALSCLQGTGVISTIFKAQSPLMNAQ